jgi:Carbohydrate family 9 binding domain-like
VLVLVAVGCYSPNPPVGVACAALGACPAPLMCVSGTCRASSPTDAPGSDAATCEPIAAGTGMLAAPVLSSPLAIDGDLSDWPTCFITIDTTTAGLVRDLGADGMFPSGKFAVAADATHLYVGAEVDGVLPLGDQPVPAIYENNAISVYIDGDGVAGSATYDSDGAQIVVDHANREQAFQNGAVETLMDVTSAATTSGSTFTIELAVDPSTFGLTAFGSTIGFDICIVAGNGSATTSELVWFQKCAPPECGCSNGDAAPYCDARELGTVMIVSPAN